MKKLKCRKQTVDKVMIIFPLDRRKTFPILFATNSACKKKYFMEHSKNPPFQDEKQNFKREWGEKTSKQKKSTFINIFPSRLHHMKMNQTTFW